jgi:hypothetical protein
MNNCRTGSTIQLPTAEEDPVQRLFECQRDMDSLKHSTVPVFIGVITKAIGMFPCWIIGPILQNWAFPTGLTTFPGGQEHIYFDSEKKQHLCVDAYCVGEVPFGKLGLENVSKSSVFPLSQTLKKTFYRYWIPYRELLSEYPNLFCSR